MQRSITPLSSKTQAQIKSSVQITSLNDVVIELVKNSFDARARAIHITVDFAKGFCEVLDDGIGIAQNEFADTGRLAEPYCTSKKKDDTSTYGRYGRFLSSLAGVSLLSITSRHVNGASINTIFLNETGRVVSHLNLDESETAIKNSGTHVVVRGLFAKLPVRVKCRIARYETAAAFSRDFEALKLAIVSLILALPYPYFLRLADLQHDRIYVHKAKSKTLMSNNLGGHQLIAVEHVQSTFIQAGIVERIKKALQPVCVRSSTANIEGYISLDPKASKRLQFISFGHRSIQQEAFPSLFKVVNAVFERSTFGLTGAEVEADGNEIQLDLESKTFKIKGSTQRRFHSGGRTVDRWPAFYIRINILQPQASELATLDQPMGHETSKLLDDITGLLEVLSEEFLESHGFLTNVTPKRTRKNNESVQSSSISYVENRTLFNSWSRVKASRIISTRDNLCGLPFREKTIGLRRLISEENESAEFSQSQHFATAADAEGEEMRTLLSVPVSPQGSEKLGMLDSENPVSWIEPQSGRTILINPRTGNIIPLRLQSKGSAPDVHIQAQDRNINGVTMVNKIVSQSDLPHLVRQLQFDDCHQLSFFQQHESPIRAISNTVSDWPSIHETEGNKGIVVNSLKDDVSPNEYLNVSDRRIKSSDLEHASVIGQVDSKFILLSILSESKLGDQESSLILVDQHAADERCNVEDLYKSVLEDGMQTLSPALVFEVSQSEGQKLESLREYFASWKCVYNVTIHSAATNGDATGTASPEHRVTVTSLPVSIADRCYASPRLVIDMLRHEIWSEREHAHNTTLDRTRTYSWLHILHLIPIKMLEMLNSRACRSSIMFNDVLSRVECEDLIHRLSKSQLPFQCAHGRPSLLAIANLGTDKASESKLQDVGPLERNNDEEQHSLSHASTSIAISNAGTKERSMQESAPVAHQTKDLCVRRQKVSSGFATTHMILDSSYDDCDGMRVKESFGRAFKDWME